MNLEDITLNLNTYTRKNRISRQTGTPRVTDDYLFLTQYQIPTEEEKEYRVLEKAINAEFKLLEKMQGRKTNQENEDYRKEMTLNINPFTRKALWLS